MRTPALAAVLLLAGCGQREAPAPTTPKLAEAAAPAAAAPRRALGTTSSLSSQTSALSGAISDFRVTVTETGTRVELATDTLFAFDQADLTPAAVPNLQRVAELIRQGGDGVVTVVGHTDAKGEDAYNLALSERRAAAVAEWLKGPGGLSGPRFAVIGKGETDPVAPNARPDGSDDPDGRARNRRVQVDIPKV